MTTKILAQVMLAGLLLQVEPVRGFGPWRLGMSKAEVTAVTQSAPYKDVPSTGGLETASGSFEGRTVNVSFVFGETGLWKIQIWAYEGKDLDEAISAWRR